MRLRNSVSLTISRAGHARENGEARMSNGEENPNDF